MLVVICSKHIPYYTYNTCQLGSCIIETDQWRHRLCFKWVTYIPGITAQTPGAELDPTVRQSVTINSTHNITVEEQNNNRWDVSHPLESYSGTVFLLRNLYSRSTQITNAVSSINFSNPSVCYPITLLFNLLRSVNIHVIWITGILR